MMSQADILDHEIGRLAGYIENRRIPFLRRVSQSKPALITIAAMVLVFQMRNLPETLANSSLDAAIAVQKPEPAPSVRLVEIDDQDYEDLFHARSPLDPQVLADILAAAAKGHPRAMVIDIDTSDKTFHDMPTPSVPIVWNVSGEQADSGAFTLYPPLGGRPLPPGSVAALAIAPQDERGVVRGYQHGYPLASGGLVNSPGYAAANIVAGRAPNDAADVAEHTHYLDYRYRFTPIKARDLLEDAKSPTWNQMALFNGKVVVLGGAYRVARDQYATPKGLLNGCEIIAQAVAAEIEGTSISAASRWMTGLMMVIGGLVTLAVYHWLRFRVAFAVSLALIPALSIASNWILFHRFAAWGAMVPLVIAVVMAELYSKAALYLTFYQKVAELKGQSGPVAEPK
ncbi:MAG: CHASE2 domain-containing protein [Acidobacteriota bacterium]|nr:CHASE2 domain-containing protein [Acidobacteriota bacterium]